MDKREIFVIGGVLVMAVVFGVAVVMMKKKKVLEMLMDIAKVQKVSFGKLKEVVDELKKVDKVKEVLEKGETTESDDNNKVKVLSNEIIKILTDNEGKSYYTNIDVTLCNKVLIPYLRLTLLKRRIRSTAGIPVSISNQQHKQLLLDLWHHFNPTTPIQFPDTQWCKHIPIIIHI